MEHKIADWYECPFRNFINPDSKYIKSHRYFHEGNYNEYPRGFCGFLFMTENKKVICPETIQTRRAGELVGDPSRHCPLKKEDIILKKGGRFGDTLYQHK